MGKQYDEDDITRLAKEIGKEFEDKFKAYQEVSDEQNKTFQKNFDVVIDRKLEPLAKDLTEVKNDMRAFKAALTETNRDVQKHERRLTKLEAAI